MRHSITAYMVVSKQFEVEAGTEEEACAALKREQEKNGIDFTGGWVTVELSPDSTGEHETIAEYWKH